MRTVTLFMLALLVALAGSRLGAQISISASGDDDSGIVRSLRDMDSLVNTLQVRLALADVDYAGGDTGIIRHFDDSVYIDRLGRLNTVFQLPYNSIIRNHIHVYTDRRSDNFRVMLGLRNYYFPMIEDIFDSYGLPTELKYIAVIESALNPNAVSRAGATGLWQFMHSTGRMYGLTINSVVDERRDPVKATDAAARYLSDLYNTYGDWFLALAAYNCGPGNVNKAIARSGNSRYYWDIYYRLPRETRGYIPQYIAAMYAMNYHHKHNITPLPLEMPVSRDTVIVNRDIHLRQVEAVTGLSYNILRALNPQYRTGLVPGRTSPMPVMLPMPYLTSFIEKQDSIANYRPNVYLATVTPASAAARTQYIPPDIEGKRRITYRVQSGDNLGYIADWFGVRAADLRHWNNIVRNTIYAGQDITVFVDEAVAGRFTNINNMTFAEKQAMAGRAQPRNERQATEVGPPPPTGVVAGSSSYSYYTVRSGDTVWDIANKFDGVSVTDILRANDISNAGRIRVGQRLKIPVRE